MGNIVDFTKAKGATPAPAPKETTQLLPGFELIKVPLNAPVQRLEVIHLLKQHKSDAQSVKVVTLNLEAVIDSHFSMQQFNKNCAVVEDSLRDHAPVRYSAEAFVDRAQVLDADDIENMQLERLGFLAAVLNNMVVNESAFASHFKEGKLALVATYAINQFGVHVNLALNLYGTTAMSMQSGPYPFMPVPANPFDHSVT